MITRKERWGVVTYKNEDGDMHNPDGPAIQRMDGINVWWFNGSLIMCTHGSVTLAQLQEFKLRTLS